MRDFEQARGVAFGLRGCFEPNLERTTSFNSPSKGAQLVLRQRLTCHLGQTFTRPDRDLNFGSFWMAMPQNSSGRFENATFGTSGRLTRVIEDSKLLQAWLRRLCVHHVVTRSERVGHGESIVVFFFWRCRPWTVAMTSLASSLHLPVGIRDSACWIGDPSTRTASCVSIGGSHRVNQLRVSA